MIRLSCSWSRLGSGGAPSKAAACRRPVCHRHNPQTPLAACFNRVLQTVVNLVASRMIFRVCRGFSTSPYHKD